MRLGRSKLISQTDIIKSKLAAEQNFRVLVQHFDAVIYTIRFAESQSTKKHFKQVHQEFPRAFAEFLKAWRTLPTDYLDHQLADID